MKHLAVLVPHPPIMVEEVGGAEVKKVEASISAMRKIAERIDQAAPDVFVVISPHSPMHSSAFVLKGGNRSRGDLSMFGAPGTSVELEVDEELRERVARYAEGAGLEVMTTQDGERETALDHGIVVPMSFITQKIDRPAICLSIIWDQDAHIKLGKVVRAAADDTGKRIALIASGDLSHRLTPSAPAGYVEDAHKFDEAIKSIIERGELMEVETLPEDLVDRAGECGLRSIYMLSGFFEGHAHTSELYSYEGPFGVGYMVAYFEDKNDD